MEYKKGKNIVKITFDRNWPQPVDNSFNSRSRVYFTTSEI